MASRTKGKTTMEVGGDGVAVITIINPPVNSLSFDVLDNLKSNYEEALGRNDVKAIVITGAKGKFSGGFDISGFGEVQKGARKEPKVGYLSIDILTDLFEAARKPSVAAIDGLALGGGLELAMACHARISAPGALLGLPELQLGVIPGFGGTQRLPRLVGLTKALEMILTSKPVKAEEGHSLGLVDAVVPPAELLNAARRWALDIAGRRKPWVCSVLKTDKLPPLGEAREILKFAREQTRKQAPNLKHPLMCLEAVEVGIVSGPRAGLEKEAQVGSQVVNLDTTKSLIHVFFSQRGTTKVPGVTDRGLVPRKIRKVAIIGGGLMGSGIATALILSNYTVILKEVNEKFLEAGIGRVKANLQSRVKKGRMSQEKFEKTMSLLKGSLDYESFKDVDMVIEAVIENISLKQQIFADLEKYCPQHCILASNTSTIDLNKINAKTHETCLHNTLEVFSAEETQTWMVNEKMSFKVLPDLNLEVWVKLAVYGFKYQKLMSLLVRGGLTAMCALAIVTPPFDISFDDTVIQEMRKSCVLIVVGSATMRMMRWLHMIELVCSMMIKLDVKIFSRPFGDMDARFQEEIVTTALGIGVSLECLEPYLSHDEVLGLTTKTHLAKETREWSNQSTLKIQVCTDFNLAALIEFESYDWKCKEQMIILVDHSPRVWEPGGVVTEHDQWKEVEKGYAYGRLTSLVQEMVFEVKVMYMIVKNKTVIVTDSHALVLAQKWLLHLLHIQECRGFSLLTAMHLSQEEEEFHYSRGMEHDSSSCVTRQDRSCVILLMNSSVSVFEQTRQSGF